MSIAIYADESEWTIADAATEPHQNEWHPSNGAARRLCRCLEGVRDLHEAISHVLLAQNRSKRRRRLRSVAVPLHSLCVSNIDLLQVIASDKQLAGRLPPNAGKDIAQLIKFLRTSVPFEAGGRLALFRNKISAHYDRDMRPNDMRAMNSSIDLTEVAEWISINIAVLSDALKLDTYTWSGGGYSRESVMIMCTEPLMTDFRVDAGQIVGINGCYLSKSPKWEIFAALRALWEKSDQMYERPSRRRIRGFFEDKPGEHWSKIIRDNQV